MDILRIICRQLTERETDEERETEIERDRLKYRETD
jgi:hypothetical protein